ncbi:hypothetical protein GCM10009716_23670 [Streptomyces sodiiphilus]|uniref:Helicase C-terminal domain-containing protein n=1 Tax=Streptomyces sodiiphilus TaxID=226217 RepID=A0ABN2P981_9ACTN
MRLPILMVDEEIYRLLPALVIATVDKMAQLPWQGYAGMLFGRVRRRCARHGYWHPDLGRRIECTGKHPKKGALPGTKELEPVSRFRPPDLIIQDELHLISGALGTTVGLFESAVDELCTWETVQEDGTVVVTGPKIVASTATTKRAAQQVRGVFGRGLAIFPPQVLEVGDTFFSRQVPVTEKTPGRRYFGVCAHGVRMKSAEIRIAEILLLAGRTLFDEHGRDADPYMTLVGYFNATRELAGMRRFLDDDVTTRVRRNGHRRVRDAGALSDRLASTGMLTTQELTSRISSADITEVLKQLENSFDPELRTSARRAAIAAELRAAKNEKRAPVVPELDFERQPVDVVLATSMLQVGVDVSRFGLMMVTGQPKNTAEYIQASSHVGRDAARPGLVVTLYNWTRPRDLAHYEDFEHYHATFYRQVEALSVTPCSRRSLDRGTAAAFIAALRNAEEAHSANRAAYDVGMDSPAAERITERFLQRAFHGGGGERGQGYLAERLAVVKERWEQAKGTSARLGYQARSENKQQMAGLLQSAGNGAWTDLTVPMSMRETENEINLLVPGSISTLTQAPYGAPHGPQGHRSHHPTAIPRPATTTATNTEVPSDRADLPEPPPPRRLRAAQPPDVHRRRRLSRGPAELRRPGTGAGRLVLRQHRVGTPRRAPAPRSRPPHHPQPQRHATPARTVAGRPGHRPERAGRPRRRTDGALPGVAALHGLQHTGRSRHHLVDVRERPAPAAGPGPLLPHLLPVEAQEAARRHRPLPAGVHRRAPRRVPLPVVRSPRRTLR